jgi:hypothetical protein
VERKACRPVEFPVTAFHAMHGSGSSQINERRALLSTDLPGATCNDTDSEGSNVTNVSKE